MIFKAVIFDLDGTLLDTLEGFALSVNAVLKRNGFSEHPVNAYRYFVGDGIEALVDRAFPAAAFNKAGFDAQVKEVKKEYSRRWPDHTRPYPGVPALLEHLESRNIPMAVFSNKPHEFALLNIEKLLSDWKFFDIIGISPGLPRKPDPQGALLIAEKMQLLPEEIVYLGDTATDMKTARAGGFYPVGALWGFRTAEELLESGARMLLRSPQDLIALFG